VEVADGERAAVGQQRPHDLHDAALLRPRESGDEREAEPLRLRGPEMPAVEDEPVAAQHLGVAPQEDRVRLAGHGGSKQPVVEGRHRAAELRRDR
jgi:hypothetical protein